MDVEALAEGLPQMLGHVEHRVEAEPVRELIRPDRRRLRGGDRLIHRGDRQALLLLRSPELADCRRQHAVDDETGVVGAADRGLADRGREARRRRHRLRRGLDALDDLDQAHHRRRVEEVEAEHALGPRRHAGQLADRQRRGVRRENRVARRCGIELHEHGLLEIELLGHRLDHEVDVAEAVVAGGRADQGERAGELLVGLRARQPLLRHQRVELAGGQLLDPLAPGVDEPLLDVAQDDRNSRRGDQLCDLGAHRACAHDAGLEHEHAQLLGVGCV